MPGTADRLRDALADAYDDLPRARELAERAGIPGTLQPIDQPDMRGWWWKTLHVAWRRGALVTLLEQAIADPVVAGYSQRLAVLRGPVAELQAQPAPEDAEEVPFGGLPRLNYRREVESIVAFHVATFVGREEEQRRIIAFAGQEAPGYLLIEANAGYGKSALLSRLIDRHQRGEWEGAPLPRLAYFLIRSEGGRNTPDAFLTAVNSQLLDLLGLPGGVPSDLPSLRTQLSQLWPRAVSAATAERSLLLLVDALDEMSADGVTVADLLPDGLGRHVHVVVTSRPNPEARQRAALEHPLRRGALLSLGGLAEVEIRQLLVDRGVETALAPEVLRLTGGEPLFVRFVAEDVKGRGEAALSELAARPPGDVEEYFRDQLDKLREAAGDADLTWAALSFLTAGMGGLSAAELAELAGSSERKVKAALRPVERYLLPGERLELMHLQLRKVLEEEIGKAELRRRREELLEWCKGYHDRGWPDDTPDYVLAHAAAHFREADDKERVYRLVDKRLMTLKRARTGSHRAFSVDLASAGQLAMEASPPEWVAFVRAALAFATLSTLAGQFSAEVLGTMARLGQVREALDHASLIPDPESRSRAYLEIAHSLIATDSTRTATAALASAQIAAEDIENDFSRASALIAVVQALTQVGDFDAADGLACRIEDDSARARALAAMARALSQSRDSEAARETLIVARVTAEGIQDDWFARDLALMSVAEGLAWGRDAEAARVAAEGIENGYPRTMALVTVAKVLSQTGDLEDARITAEGIEDEGRRVEAMAYVARAQARVGDNAAAGVILASARTTTDSIEYEIERAGALAEVVTVLAEAGNLEDAYATAEDIEHSGYRAQAFVALANAMAQAGYLEAARKTLDIAYIAAQEVTDNDYRTEMLTHVATALTQLGEVGAACGVAEGIPNGTCRAGMLAEIARVLAQAGDAEGARMILVAACAAAESIQDDLFSTQALAAIAQELAETGNVEPACSILAVARAAAEGIEDHGEQIEALARVAIAFSGVGEVEFARETLMAAKTAAESMEDAKRADALAVVAEALAHIGDVDAARISLTAARAAAYRIEDERERVSTLATVAQSLFRTGDLDAAREVADACRVVAERISDDDNRADALADVAMALTHTGGVAAAREMAWRMVAGYSRDRSLAVVAHALSESGNVTAARVVSRAIRDDSVRAMALATLATTLAQGGGIRAARSMLSSARRIAEGIADVSRLWTLGAVARALARVGELRAACAIAQNIGDHCYKASTLASVAEASAESGQTILASEALRNAFETAMHGGRWDVLTVLGQSASALSAIAGAEMLRRVAEAVLEVEGWWARPP